MPVSIAKELGITDIDTLRDIALKDLYVFARLINPNRVYGECHKELFRWWMEQEDDGVRDTLVLMPRDHQKSHCAAVKCLWEITRNPAIAILYVSATERLAISQLNAIKMMMESERYQVFWPDMIHPDKGKRAKWTDTQIMVDHPARTKAGQRDATLFAGGLTKVLAGAHCNEVFFDDIVVPQNAYTGEGREKVLAFYSQFASIATTNAKTTIVGTRYHPVDLYKHIAEMTVPILNESFQPVGEKPVYAIFERVVEKNGQFLWPRTYEDGAAFGFDWEQLYAKKAKYLDKAQFFAQYYNDPNDPTSDRLKYSDFQYYQRERLRQDQGRWYHGHTPLALYAYIDFAYTDNATSDYTALSVIGVCPDNNVYVLELFRKKMEGKVKNYYDMINDAHLKWGFRKLGVEITAAQQIISNDLKDLFRRDGSPITIKDYRPDKRDGSKAERIAATLEPRYENGSIFHYKGGHTPALEEELVLAKPPHDDLKDSLAGAVGMSKPPVKRYKQQARNYHTHSRFGGRY